MDLNKIILFWFVGFSCCYAQDPATQKVYFKSYNDKVTASAYYFQTSNSFQFVSKVNGQNNYYDLNPNKREQIGFNLSYKLIDISYGFSPNFFNANKDNSNSKLTNFGTRFIVKRWMQTLLYMNQKGFFASDENFNASYPRMRSIKIGGTTSYIFNPNFSFRTIANQNEWQTRSSGSFIPTLTIYHNYLKLDDGFEDTKKRIWLVSITPSYYYNWVINDHVLISSGVAFGPGFNTFDDEFSPIIDSSVNLKLGYNSDSFFTFVKLNYSIFVQENNNPVRFNDELNTFNFTVGYRFNPPKKVKQLYDEGEKYIEFKKKVKK